MRPATPRCTNQRAKGYVGLTGASRRTLIDTGILHADAAAAHATEDRILDDDAHASPTVHRATVTDLADEFTRLDLTDPATSCRQATAFGRVHRAIASAMTHPPYRSDNSMNRQWDHSSFGTSAPS